MKRSPLFKLVFHETYYFVNIIHNVFTDPSSYLRKLEDITGGEQIGLWELQAFDKVSLLHKVAQQVISQVILEETDELGGLKFWLDEHQPKPLLWIEQLLKRHDFKHDSFLSFLTDSGKHYSKATQDDVSEYYEVLQLCGPFEELCEKLAEEVFYVLFNNRQFLQSFNKYISGRVGCCDIDFAPFEGDEQQLVLLFRKPGVLKRVSIPLWARKAVFLRDKGCCCFCNKDLTGLISVWSKQNYDHIVPLALGGVNDVSNLQLLCRECNQSKGGRSSSTSDMYQPWY